MVMAMEDAADEETAKRLRKVDFLNVVGQLARWLVCLAPSRHDFGISIHRVGGRECRSSIAGWWHWHRVGYHLWGLVVAIPALMGYAVIRNRILNASEEVISGSDN